MVPTLVVSRLARVPLRLSVRDLFLLALFFRKSQDKSFGFHGVSFAVQAKAPTIPNGWPTLVIASVIDQRRPERK